MSLSPRSAGKIVTAVLDFVDTFKRFTEEIILIRKLIENSESRSLTYYDGLYGTKTIKTTTFVGGIHNEKD